MVGRCRLTRAGIGQMALKLGRGVDRCVRRAVGLEQAAVGEGACVHGLKSQVGSDLHCGADGLSVVAGDAHRHAAIAVARA